MHIHKASLTVETNSIHQRGFFEDFTDYNIAELKRIDITIVCVFYHLWVCVNTGVCRFFSYSLWLPILYYRWKINSHSGI